LGFGFSWGRARRCGSRLPLLRTDERKFAARSKSVGEHYAGKHEGKRHTDKSKSKSKSKIGMLTRRLFF